MQRRKKNSLKIVSFMLSLLILTGVDVTKNDIQSAYADHHNEMYWNSDDADVMNKTLEEEKENRVETKGLQIFSDKYIESITVSDTSLYEGEEAEIKVSLNENVDVGYIILEYPMSNQIGDWTFREILLVRNNEGDFIGKIEAVDIYYGFQEVFTSMHLILRRNLQNDMGETRSEINLTLTPEHQKDLTFNFYPIKDELKIPDFRLMEVKEHNEKTGLVHIDLGETFDGDKYYAKLFFAKDGNFNDSRYTNISADTRDVKTYELNSKGTYEIQEIHLYSKNGVGIKKLLNKKYYSNYEPKNYEMFVDFNLLIQVSKDAEEIKIDKPIVTGVSSSMSNANAGQSVMFHLTVDKEITQNEMELSLYNESSRSIEIVDLKKVGDMVYKGAFQVQKNTPLGEYTYSYSNCADITPYRKQAAVTVIEDKKREHVTIKSLDQVEIDGIKYIKLDLDNAGYKINRIDIDYEGPGEIVVSDRPIRIDNEFFLPVRPNTWSTVPFGTYPIESINIHTSSLLVETFSKEDYQQLFHSQQYQHEKI